MSDRSTQEYSGHYSLLGGTVDLELEQQQLFDGPNIEGTHVEYHHLCLGLGAREEEKARPVDLRGDDQEVDQNGLLERLQRPVRLIDFGKDAVQLIV